MLKLLFTVLCGVLLVGVSHAFADDEGGGEESQEYNQDLDKAEKAPPQAEPTAAKHVAPKAPAAAEEAPASRPKTSTSKAKAAKAAKKKTNVKKKKKTPPKEE